jgi:hypothetical protein
MQRVTEMVETRGDHEGHQAEADEGLGAGGTVETGIHAVSP